MGVAQPWQSRLMCTGPGSITALEREKACWLRVLLYKHEDCHWDLGPRQKLGIVLHTCDATVEDNQWNFLASSLTKREGETGRGEEKGVSSESLPQRKQVECGRGVEDTHAPRPLRVHSCTALRTHTQSYTHSRKTMTGDKNRLRR